MMQAMPPLLEIFPVRVTYVGLAVNQEHEAVLAVGVVNRTGHEATLAFDRTQAEVLRRELERQVPRLETWGTQSPEAN